jgi:hypothetical protein
MKKSIFGMLISLQIILLGSCATVKFYSDPDMNNETGLKVYNAKPYLLVAPNSEKDNTNKTTVIWLPDYANPQYVTVTSGFGSSKLELGFTNGSLSSVGTANEGAVPDIIDALASLVSKSAYAATNLTAPPVGQEQLPEVPFELYEIVIGKEGTVLKKIDVGK